MSKQYATCKLFNDKKGYGFLVNDNGEDVFVHYRSILADDQYKSLNEDQKVLFTASAIRQRLASC